MKKKWVGAGAFVALFVGFVALGAAQSTSIDSPQSAIPSESAHPSQVLASRSASWVNSTVGYQALRPGSQADRYLTSHWSCEGALRIQYVAGYRPPKIQQEPLWKYLCSGVSDKERDRMAEEAVVWGSSHPNG